MNTLTSIYEDIAARTAGDIYLGVVGPARTGKSTFIKRFMETLVLPSIDDDYRRQRARDELPQSGSGRTVMTAEPKFVPEEAVEIAMEGGGTFSVRLVDCVGYLVPGAVGQLEDGEPRMVHTPWFPQEIPMAEAAEIGTRKVIAEHATIGIVITTDGTITDLPREAYPEAEGRVIEELKALGKPFLILLNSAHPQGEAAQKLRAKLAEQYDVTCLAVSCLDLDQQAVTEIIQAVLYEFPLEELQLFLPDWVETLPTEHPIRTALFQAIRAQAGKLVRIRDVKPAVAAMGQCELVTGASVTAPAAVRPGWSCPAVCSMTPSPSRRASPCTATGSFWPCWNDWPWSRPSTKRSPPPWRRCGPRATASSFPKPKSWSWSSRRSSNRAAATGSACGPRPPAST